MTAQPVRRQLLVAALGTSLPLLGTAKAPAKATTKKAAPAAVRDDGALDVVTYGGRDDVMRFAGEVAERQGLDVAAVRSALAQARFIPSVTRYIMPPPAGAAKNWAAYRARFVEPVRIRGGTAFWRANAQWLAQAEALYGVPPEIVVAIVGVESIYGQQMGNFRVIDALATLSFDFPAGRKDRSDFFRGELEQWFVLCKSEGVDPLAWRGSYAGAFGMAQFMPSSFNKYAVDLDGDGHVDLHKSGADTAGSIAHYLAEFGWKRGLPTHYAARPPTDVSDRAALLAPDIVPTFTAAELLSRGATLPDAARDSEGLLALVELQNGAAAPTYIAATSNFYAITRYNWSAYYALAVAELGAALRGAIA